MSRDNMLADCIGTLKAAVACLLAEDGREACEITLTFPNNLDFIHEASTKEQWITYMAACCEHAAKLLKEKK